MKAAVRSFTLAADLNPGITGLQSAPVSGKKTGDMLTAGEWNRVLELAAQGGGGGGTGGSGWESVPLTDTAAFDPSCDYRVKVRAPSWDNINGVDPMVLAQQVSPTILVLTQASGGVNGVYSNSKDKWRQNGAINTIATILSIDKRCGGTGGGGGGTAPAASAKICYFVYVSGTTGSTFNSHAHAVHGTAAWTSETCRNYLSAGKGGATNVYYYLGCVTDTGVTY